MTKRKRGIPGKRLKRAGGELGNGLRDRLRALIRDRATSNAEFARRCGIDAPRLTDWLSGAQLPSTSHLWDIAERSGVSLDWLLCGEGGPEPVYRGQTRTRAELADDVAAYLVRELHAREHAGELDDPESGVTSRPSIQGWVADGRGLLADLVTIELERIREWRVWEDRTDLLNGISNELLTAVRALVPLLPHDDTHAGAQIYRLGAAAVQARDFQRYFVAPPSPHAWHRLRGRLSMSPRLTPAKAGEEVNAMLKRLDK